MFKETKTVWRYLQTVKKPIIMYGMGDGAEKILNVMENFDIKPSEFMASDEFVRGHSFHGFEVKKLSDIETQYSGREFIIIVCFGTSRPEVLEKLYRLSERYELYAPDVPVYGSGLFDEKYIGDNIKKIVQVREILADALSKETLDRLIDYRISGKIDILRGAASPRKEAAELLNLKKDGSEFLVDLGAYDGDTVQEFLDLTEKRFKKIYALEPDTRNYMKLRRRHYALGSAIFIPFNAAAWDEDGKIGFSQRGGRQSYALLTSENTDKKIKTVDTRSVDSLCKNENPTLIKIDTEGCEKKALLGANEVIKRSKPKMIVSLYHRTEDMLELPLLVKQLNPNYKLYLRHHEYVPAWDTNLYCV